MHDPGRQILLLTSLAALAAGDYLERQVGKASVDQRPRQRLQPRTSAVTFASDAEGGFAQAPEGVSGEPDAEQPERDYAVGRSGEQL